MYDNNRIKKNTHTHKCNSEKLTFLLISVRFDQSLFNPLSPFSMSSSFLSLFFRSSLSFGISLDDTFWLDSTVSKKYISMIWECFKCSCLSCGQRVASYSCLWQDKLFVYDVDVLLLRSFSFSESRSSFSAVCIHTSPAQAMTQAASTMKRNKG